MFQNGENVTWLKRTENGTDHYGRPLVEFEEVTLANVGVAPGSSSEPRRDGSERSTTQMTLYFTVNPGIHSGDRVKVRGVEYSVEGDIGGTWVNPFTGSNFGCEIALKRVRG